MVALVIRPTDVSGTYIWWNGGTGGNEIEIFTGGSALKIYAGSTIDTGLSVTAAQWHTIIVKFNGASSTAEMDGVAGTGGDAGAHTIDTFTLNSENGALAGKGMHALCMVWGGTLPTAAQVRSYISKRLGTNPQG
jgi:hypothetical protein